MSTKILAKKLGLIRKRNNISDDTPRSSASGQRFNFLIIIDFESTCWREKKFSPEIIEFPAVLLDVSNGQIRSEFHTYIQPQEHLVLSSFCRELTGITQEQVDSSPPLHVCLSQFNRWMEMLERENGVVFETDSTSPDHNCAFVTWSDWDLGVCLLYECKRKQIRVPEPLKSWIDLRATYRLFYNRKPKGLRGALLDLGLQFSGREHSGLVDARNTALLALRMMSDGCMLNVTKSLRQTGAKCKRVKCDRLSAKVCEQSNPHTDVDNGSVQVCVDGSGSLAGLSDTTYDPEALDICWREEEESRSYDDVVLEAGPNDITTWLCGPSGLEETHSSASTAEPQRPEHSRRSHSGPHSFKITSPLCKCGRRTRLLTASRAGPNNGRAFYCCSSSKKRCSFFMWESVLLNRIRTTRSV